MDWKKALILGSLAGGAALFLTGRRPAGLIVAGVGVATLASEHPEELEQLWRRLPDYVDKSGRLVNLTAAVLERIIEHARGYHSVPSAGRL